MSRWQAPGWQVLDDESEQTVVGVTFGVGLLDEPLAQTGALGVAVAALRQELGRPVELPGGRVAVPEAVAEVSTDTSTVLVRGSREVVAAAWSRLPEAFRRDLVSDEVPSARPENPVWPADLVQRTGRSAAALAWLQATVPEAHELGRARLLELDPRAGAVRSAFFTTDASLVDGSGPGALDPSLAAAPRSTWADGTPRLPQADRPGSLAVDEGPVLLSTLVPRTGTGLAAASLLRRQLMTTMANTVGGEAGVEARALGLGADLLLVVLVRPGLDPQSRRKVVDAYRSTLDLVPDAWVDEVVADPDARTSPRLVRERAVLGLPDDDEEARVDAADVRAAVRRAARHLHVALPTAAEGAPGTAGGPAPDDALAPFAPDAPLGAHRTFTTWSRRGWGDSPATATTTVHVGRGAVLSGVPLDLRTAAPLRWSRVDTTRPLVVFEDQAGSVTLVDEQMRVAAFHPGLFRHGAELRSVLDERLGKVPHLRFTTDVDGALVAATARRDRRRWLTRRLLPVAAVAAVAVVVVLASLGGGGGPSPVEARVTIGDTVELANGTRITATGLDAVPTTRGEPFSAVRVEVEFCAGDDTDDGDVPPETQRTVAPGDFGLYDRSVNVPAELVPTDGELPSETLPQGECASGALVFEGLALDEPRLSYENDLGDDVVWYLPGKVVDAS